MSDLYWLTDEQMRVCRRISPRATASAGSMIAGC